MRIPIAEEGRKPILAGAAVALGCLAVGGRLLRAMGWGAAAATAGLAFFYRDPDRVTVPIENGVLAPADGKVIRIDTVTPNEFFYEPVRRVSIFMSVFDCHVNRMPVTGKIVHKSRDEGGFLAAWNERASEENRRAGMGIEGGFPVFVRQVAGLVARQIVSRPQIGETLSQGERYGMIKFGSRLDVFFPLDLKLMVNVGDRTWAGITALAERQAPAVR